MVQSTSKASYSAGLCEALSASCITRELRDFHTGVADDDDDTYTVVIGNRTHKDAHSSWREFYTHSGCRWRLMGNPALIETTTRPVLRRTRPLHPTYRRRRRLGDYDARLGRSVRIGNLLHSEKGMFGKAVAVALLFFVVPVHASLIAYGPDYPIYDFQMPYLSFTYQPTTKFGYDADSNLFLETFSPPTSFWSIDGNFVEFHLSGAAVLALVPAYHGVAGSFVLLGESPRSQAEVILATGHVTDIWAGQFQSDSGLFYGLQTLFEVGYADPSVADLVGNYGVWVAYNSPPSEWGNPFVEYDPFCCDVPYPGTSAYSHSSIYFFDQSPAAISAPGTLSLLVGGLLAFVAMRKRQPA